MDNNRKICEQIEIAIYSDAELTNEQKNHIENCESCRALLSQVSCMKADLATLEIPRLEHGKIADAVMTEIANKKLSAPFPKFNFTHHIGTAAAVVIILAAALMIKNPSETDNFSAENAENGSAVIVHESTINNHVLNNVADTTEESYVDDTATGARIVEYSTQDEADTSEFMTFKKSANTQHAPAAIAEEEAAILFADQATDDLAAEVEDSGAAFNAVMKSGAKQEKYIFDGLDFKSGSENFDFNISLANQRLKALYGDEYIISKDKLVKLGVNNAKLLKIVPTVTEEMFDFYKNIFDIFE